MGYSSSILINQSIQMHLVPNMLKLFIRYPNAYIQVTSDAPFATFLLVSAFYVTNSVRGLREFATCKQRDAKKQTAENSTRKPKINKLKNLFWLLEYPHTLWQWRKARNNEYRYWNKILKSKVMILYMNFDT